MIDFVRGKGNYNLVGYGLHKIKGSVDDVAFAPFDMPRADMIANIIYQDGTKPV